MWQVMPKNAWSDTADWQKIDLLSNWPTPCNRGFLYGVCSDCLEVLVMGRNRTTRLMMSTSFFINKMKQGFCQMFAELDKSSPLQKKTNSSVMCEIKFKNATLVFSKMFHLQVVCEIQNQRQEVYCVCIGRTIFPTSCATSILQCLHTAVMSLIKFRLTQVYVWMDFQLFNFGSVSWKHYPVRQPKGTLSVTNAKESFCLIHILTNVHLSKLATFHPTFPTAPIQPDSANSKTAL